MTFHCSLEPSSFSLSIHSVLYACCRSRFYFLLGLQIHRLIVSPPDIATIFCTQCGYAPLSVTFERRDGAHNAIPTIAKIAVASVKTIND